LKQIKFVLISLYKHFPLIAIPSSLKNQTTIETSQEGSRTQIEQAFAQLAAIGVTLAFAAVGGAFTGKLIHFKNVFVCQCGAVV